MQQSPKKHARFAPISLFITLCALLAATLGVSSQPVFAATTLTQWNFNSNPADANTATGSTTPALGSGSATLVGTTATFASGDASGGSSDPATGDDSGWNATSFAPAGTANETRGVQFNLSTVGQQNIIVSWDQRHSNTASRFVRFQYTSDGSTWVNIDPLFEATAGDVWANGRSVNLSAISAVNNNPNVGFRVVAAFSPTTGDYAASNPASTYGTTGTWRFDMVTITSDPLGPPVDSAPDVAATIPANNATNVALTSDVTITFSEPVTVTGDWFTLACAITGNRSIANSVITGGPTVYTINPNLDFANSELCTLTIVATAIADQDTNDPPDTMTGDIVRTFTTIAPPAPGTRIRDIQGAAHTSPLIPIILDNAISFGNRVENVAGIVTVVRPNGFYMQDASPDTNDATSEGIFVFTGTNQAIITEGGTGPIQIGDAVEISGRPVEIRGGCTSASCTPTSSGWNNLTLTNLNATTSAADNRIIRLISRANSLPAPIVIGIGGRIPPTTATVFGSTGTAPTNTVETASYPFNPTINGLDFFESLEGMRVQVNDAVVVGPTNNFGEIVVLADNGAGQGVRTPRGGLVISASDLNPERIILDDVILPTPAVNIGDRFAGAGAAIGVMDYSFANYKFLITQALPPATPSGITQETTSLLGGNNRLTVGTFNIENFAAQSVTAARKEAIARLIVTNLGAPDILALQEIQDNNGATGGTANTNVDASQTYQALIDAIVAVGGPTYQFRQIDPVANQDGGEPGGNIRVGFLFRTDRGLSFVDRLGGTATNAVSAVAGTNGPELSFNPGRIDPTNLAFANSRKPLVGEFQYNGRAIFIVNNHFNSKGGDQLLGGRFQPPSRSSEIQRHQQAQLVNDFVDSILALDPNAHVLVTGDLNDFQFSETLNIVRGIPGGSGTPVLFDPKLSMPASEQYTYIFEGNSQVLDSTVFSAALRDRAAAYDTVHVNSEFASNASDHDPSVARFYFPPVTTPPALVAVSTYDTGLAANGAEIISIRGDRAILSNAGDGSLDILDTSNLLNIQRIQRITGLADLTSVAIHPTKDLFVAVAGTSGPPRSGSLKIFRLSDGALLASADLGRQPDSVEISPDGRYAVIAIEAQQVNATDDGGAGAIAVVDLTAFDPASSTTVAVSLVELPDITGLPGTSVGRLADVPGNPAISNAPGGLEPEGIGFSADSATVYLTLQENNAIARLDLNAPLPATLAVDAIFGLGQTIHPVDLVNGGGYLPAQTLSAFREPDGIRVVEIAGVRYLVTADEGDTRPNPRGGRTVSIFNAATGAVVADTGAQLDDLAALFGVYPDSRSPNGGTEPEMLDIASFARRVIVAVGLERANAIGLVDMTNPAAPFAFSLIQTGAAPEGIKLIERAGQLYALSANEVSGTLTVATIPVVPLSIGQSYIEDTPTALLDLRGIDPNSAETFSLNLTIDPALGSLSQTSATGTLAQINTILTSLTFTPALNFTGPITITASLSDGNSPAANATIALSGIAVNDAPVAVADSYTTAEDTVLNVPANGVLANDSDVDSANLTAELTSAPSNGTLTLNPDGSFNYLPNANFFGSDSFSYTASDGALSSEVVQVTIEVTAVNDPPTIQYAGPVACAAEEVGQATIRVLIADIDSPALAISLAPGAPNWASIESVNLATGEVTIALISDLRLARSALIGIRVSDGTLTADTPIGVHSGSRRADIFNAQTAAGGSFAHVPNIILGFEGADILSGGNLADIICGGAGANTIHGNDGDDRLVGGSRADIIFGGNGNDILNGNAGSDSLFGGAGNDDLNGHAGNDLLSGGDDNDRLTGGSGTDFFDGGTGTNRGVDINTAAPEYDLAVRIQIFGAGSIPS
jgi:Ca2+-binding RTX toxin-like protein